MIANHTIAERTIHASFSKCRRRMLPRIVAAP
jgi:hypothetical protein